MHTVNVQIRDVPDRVHRTLKMRAVQSGMTLSQYLLRELTIVAERPMLEDVLARIRTRGPARVSTNAAAAVRAERTSRS